MGTFSNALSNLRLLPAIEQMGRERGLREPLSEEDLRELALEEAEFELEATSYSSYSIERERGKAYYAKLRQLVTQYFPENKR